MSDDRARNLSRVATGAWLLLLISVACWMLGPSAAGAVTTAIAFLPLLLPLPGLVRGVSRTLRWAPLTLAPALALTLTELLVSEALRPRMTVTLAWVLAAFAANIAALRGAGHR